MSDNTEDSSTHVQLRRKAETRISGGNAPATKGWTLGAESLTLLHRLASNPDTASDALKLLHELQVHQIELDLQHEHINEERQAQEQSTHRLAELYVFAPVAYFMVNGAGQIAEGNFVGARMLGVAQGEIDSYNINRLVAPDSRPALLAFLEQVISSGLPQNCRVQAIDTTKSKWFEMTASASPGGQHCLVVVVEASDPPPVKRTGVKLNRISRNT